MKDKKQLPEQIASHTYKRQAVGAPKAPYVARRSALPKEKSREDQREAERTLGRVVTIPEADPSLAWNTFAQRQEERRRARAKPYKYSEAVPRTLAQTGMRASSGRMKVVRPSTSYSFSRVPTRSGRMRVQRNFFLKILSFFVVAMFLILAGNLLITSSAFRVAQVNVVGTRNDALIRSIQHMGIQGQNIFLINVAAITDQINASPLVASASLSKQWPNQLLVTVKERVPVVYWQTAQGTYSVDSQGVVIGLVNASTDIDRSKIVIDMGSPSKNGQSGKARTIQSGTHLNRLDIEFAMNVLDHLPKLVGNSAFKLHYNGMMPSGVNDNVGKTNSEGSFTIESSEGWTAYLGGVTDINPLDNRLIELQQILEMAQKRQINVAIVDIRYGLRPVYTLKQ